MDVTIGIIQILDKNKCANVNKYNGLIEVMRDKCNKLEEKLKALNLLKEPFKNLDINISVENVYNILPTIVNRLKLIFKFSKYYKHSDKINDLITLLLNEFIRKLQNYIDLSKLYTKEVKELSGTLDECINFVTYWEYLINISFNISQEKNEKIDNIIQNFNLSNVRQKKEKKNIYIYV